MNWPNTRFRDQLKLDFAESIGQCQSSLNVTQCLKMDLHCHDKNSDVPDELWGRILGIPETWLKTSNLVDVLQRNGSTALTITNHNNARSCWKLKEKGIDVLVGAEFTCHFVEYNAYIHVLAYGFTQEQEAKLNRHRKNIYRFCEYCLEENIPTILPHPTYLYFKNKRVSIEILEKLALMFERLEVLNGQRDIWQNMLTLTWLQGLKEDNIRALEKKHGLNSLDFCKQPYHKSFSGGTDDHMGIFAGSCGTLIEIENFQERSKLQPLSELALEGLRQGRIAPYGHLGNVNEKLNIAFLDYFCQVTLNMEDPGLTRIMLHKGDMRDKLFCLGIANGIFELRRHGHTMSFLKTLHKAIRGKTPNPFKKLFISKNYRPIFEKVVQISTAMERGPDAHIQAMRDFIEQVYSQLNHIVVDRLAKKFNEKGSSLKLLNTDWDDLLNRLEMPVNLRSLVGGSDLGGKKMNSLSLGKIFDQLSFPILASVVLAASTYTSTRVMFNARYLLDDLSESIGAHQHPKRILWLTDTLYDKNGVSMFLQQLLALVRKHDLPIDFLTCGTEAYQEDHLHVIQQVCEFNTPSYGEQVFKLPNLMDLQKIFYEGAYDRVVCSTEIMGWMAIYLKTAFSVPAHFYMHTDWMDFFKRSVHLEEASLGRLRRLLRFFYQRFDGVFVLNEEHRSWLTGQDMGLSVDQVFKTAHWAADGFEPRAESFELREDGFEPSTTTLMSGKKITQLLYVGRLSEEKGVHDLPILMQCLDSQNIAVELTIIGDGPSRTALGTSLPQAKFLGWMTQAELVQHYQNADLLLLPSRFDTFGCVVIEAMTCGCPVVAYNCKGPKDIIEHQRSGYLPNNIQEMSDMVAEYILNGDHLQMRQAAIERSKHYEAMMVVQKMLKQLGLEMPSST